MSDPKPPRAKWPKRLGIALAAIAVLIAIIGFGAEPALRAGLVWALERDGTMQAAIADAEIDLHPLTVTLQDVRLTPRTGEGEGVSAALLRARLGLRALFDRRVFLHGVRIQGLETRLAQGEAGKWRAGGIPLPGQGAGAAEPPEQKPATPPDEQWQIGLADLTIADSRLHLVDEGIDQRIAIRSLSLGRLFPWAPAADTTLALTGALAGARVDLEGKGQPLGTGRNGRITLQLRDFPLTAVAPLLTPAGIGDLRGRMTIDMSFGGAPDGKGGFKADATGSLALRDLSMTTAGGPVSMSALDWKGKVSATRAGGGNAAAEAGSDGALAIRGVSLGTGHGPVSVSALDWNGTVSAKKAGGAAAVSEAGADGSMKMRGLSASIDGRNARLDSAEWKGSTELRHDPGRTEYAQLRGALGIKGVRVARGGDTASVASLSWDGWVSGSHSAPADETALNLRGALKGQTIALDGVSEGLVIRAERAAWTGQGEALRSKESAELLGSLDGSVEGDRITVDAETRDLRLGSVESVRLSGVSVSLRNTAFVREATLHGVRAIQQLNKDGDPGQALVTVETASGDKAGYTPSDGAQLGDLRFDGASLILTHIGDGQFAIVPTTTVPPEAAEEEKAEKKPAQKAERRERRRPRAWPGARLLRKLAQPAFSVNSITIDGDSSATLMDVTVQPAWKARIKPLQVAIGELNSAKPQHETIMALNLGLPAGGTLRVSGYMSPFLRELTGSMHTTVDRMELPALSPMTRRHMGLVLRTGRLQGDLDLEAKTGKLTGRSTIGIDRLEVEVADNQKAAPLVRRLPVRIDTALNLLRNGRGRIELTVPISGDVRDPKFDVSDVINQAIGNALAETAKTTLKVLFPVGALASAIFSDSGVNVAPMTFIPGTAKPSGEGQAYVDQLHKLLAERPGITVALCGKAVPADREAILEARGKKAAEGSGASAPEPAPSGTPFSTVPQVTQDQLEALAQSRANAMRRMLTASNGVDAGRLLRCAPDLDTRADGKPRVELSF